MEKLSIIVVAYNESENLARLKRSMDAQTVPPEWRIETVLVDNGSYDETRNLAVELGFTRVVQDDSATVSGCRNWGGHESSGKIICFVDADCEIGAGWIQQVIDLLGEQDYAIAGWPVSPPSPMSWVQHAWQAHWTNKRGRVEDEVFGERAMTMITTANMSMTRDLFQLLGGFDESLHSGEDTNFMLRAHQKGVKICANLGLKVIHHGEPKTLSDFYRQQQWHCSKKSLREIWRANRGETGGNALWFTLAYTASFSLTIACVIGGLFVDKWLYIGIIPILVLLIFPALVIAWRAGDGRLAYELPVLYGVYGWVRMSDLVGMGAVKKKSWRTMMSNECAQGHRD